MNIPIGININETIKNLKTLVISQKGLEQYRYINYLFLSIVQGILYAEEYKIAIYTIAAAVNLVINTFVLMALSAATNTEERKK